MKKHFFGNAFVRVISAAFITSILSVALFAQDLDDVVISGKITDSTGAAIVGATVTATLASTGAERTTTTDGEGKYRFIELQPGTYSIKAVSDGFAPLTKADLTTVSGQGVQLDFELSPGDVVAEQTVTIGDDDAPLIDTTRTVVGSTISEKEIDEIPNGSRDALDLVFTLGGVTEEPLSTRDLSVDKGTSDESAPRNSPEEVGVFALSGGAAYSNNITIDGFDNNDDRIASYRFQPSVESIREVQVITNQFSAEYGRASGGRVNILTKAGGRKFSGRAFYYFRDDSLNANTWSNNRRNVARPEFQQNVPGFAFGGPIPIGPFKNKTFFYSSYEYDYIFDSTLIDTWVPLAQNPNFPLPTPTSSEVITDFPDTVWASDLGRYLDATDTPRKRQTFTLKLDHNFSASNYINFNYQFGTSDDKRQFNGGNRLAETLVGKKRDTQAFNFTHNWVINGSTVNQAKFQYSTLKPQLVASGQFTDPVVLVSFREPGNTFNTTLVAGSSTLGSSDRKEIRYQVEDVFNKIFGSNTFRTGFSVQHIDSTYIDLGDASGTFNFGSPLSTTQIPQCLIDPNDLGSGRIRSGVQSYTRGCVQRYRHNFFTDSQVKNTYFGVFVQDEWRALSNLSLNFGVRYERETVIKDNNNFGPRFALAWSPFKNDKGVIRFGAGIFYNRVLLRTVDDYQRGSNEIIFDTNRVASASRDTYLQSISDNFPNVLTADSPLVQQYIDAGLNNNSFFRSLSPDIKIPESYQFNIGFEHSLGKSMVFEANFTFNRTLKLWREKNTNAPIVPEGYTDLADYLANGITTGNIRFEFAGIGAPDNRTDAGVTYYNLDSQNTSTAAATPYGRALVVADSLRPEPLLGQTEQVGSLGNSWYRGLVLELRRRYRKLGGGFAFSTRVAYTLSYLEDDGIVNTSSAQVQGDFASERSRSLLDRRHRLAVTGYLDTPSWMGKLRFSPIWRFGSSAPFNLSNGGSTADDRNLDDVNTDRPNFSGNIDDIVWRRVTDPVNTAVLNAITLAPIGRAGNLPRNAGTGPRQYIFDLNVSRQFKFNDRIRLRPQIEFDNILNQTVYSFGSEFIDASQIAGNPTPEEQQVFLSPTRAYRPRQLRFGIRLDF
ncbi:MAG: carboxypeptidase regulatory-like domain-containing protein [Pyrinomonadaceae bacterium]